MKLTPARIKWLQKLNKNGVAKRPRGRVGYDCMVAGLTEWAYLDNEKGDTVGFKELQERYGIEKWWARGENIGEMLTDKGREVLEYY